MFHHPSGDPPRGAVFFADEPNDADADGNNDAAAADPGVGAKRKSKLGKQVKSILRRGGSDGSSVS